jgi:predicted permease
VRTALGASRGRVIAQLLTEGVLLSLFATVVGVAVASAGLRVLVHAISDKLPRAEEITLDWRVALFAIALTAATALLFALAPAVQLARLGSASAIRASGRGIAGGSGRKLRQSLVVLETALALMLLASAGLLGRTLIGLQQIRPGFDATSVLYTQVGFPPAQFTTPAEQLTALNRVLEHAAALPGANAAGAISDLPMSGAVNSTSVLRTDRPLDEKAGLSTLVRALAGDYLGSMQVPVRQGRAFSTADAAGSTEVALVNEVFAQRMFPNENPLGKVVLVRGVQREIVGVVGAVKEFTLTGDLEPALYTPFAQERESWMRENMTVVLRSGGDPAAQLRGFADAVRSADPSLTMYPPKPLASVIAADVAAPRSRALLLSLFALIAVLLATVGIGSVLAYSVSQRLPELGVRLAIGARPIDVMRMVLGESAWLAGAGLLAGTIGALATGRLLARFLYGVSPADPLVLIGSVFLLLAAALVASFIPARRGARTDPAIVLRGN